MTINELAEIIKVNEDLVIGMKPYDCGSWRGSYDEPCLFADYDASSQLSDWLPYLERLTSGEYFEGYKGGSYRYSGHSTINIEREPRNYSDTDGIIRLLVEIEKAKMRTPSDWIGVKDRLPEPGGEVEESK